MDNESVNREENIDLPDLEENAEADKKQKKKDKKIKKSARPKRKFSYYFTGGIIMSLLGRLTDTVYRWLSEGLFGTIFTAYSPERALVGNGALQKYLSVGEKAKRTGKKARGVFAEAFEKSFFVSFFDKMKRYMLEMPLKNYGNYFFSFGLFAVFAYVVKHFIAGLGEPKTSDLVAGVAYLLIAVPMLSSKRCLADALDSSSGARAVLCEAFGLRDESFEIKIKRTRLRSDLSILLGIASGLLSFLVDVTLIPAVVLVMVFIALVISAPEIGVIVSLFMIPFFSLAPNPSLTLAALLGVSAVGYLIKIIRGKRIIKFELVDSAVILFSILIFFSGAISVGGKSSLYDALLLCVLILVYFLTVNMMRTDRWIRRCVMALVISAVIVSVVGIIEYFFGDITTRWLDVEYFPDIKGRAAALFDNANVLAFYLVMVFPFALGVMSRCKNKREKFLTFMSISAIVLCVVLTWSRGAWIGLIVAALLYFLIKTRKTLKALFGMCFLIPVLPIILPQNVILRFLSIGDMSDSSTYYRFHTWLGSFDMLEDHFFGGIGLGSSAFNQIYPQYAHAGIESAEHTHNLFLQITVMMGVCGLVAFLAVLLLFAQKNMEYYRSASNKDPRFSVAVSAFCSVVCAITMGMFDYIWYNNRIFFLFWAVLALSCAAVRISDSIAERTETEIVCDKKSAFLDIT